MTVINKILNRNYNILIQLFENKKATQLTIEHLSLAKLGFQFEYCTRVYINSQRKLYRYVYDFRWTEFSDQQIAIYKDQKKQKILIC